MMSMPCAKTKKHDKPDLSAAKGACVFEKAVVIYKSCLERQVPERYPGVAKFGIALEWGSRGLEFESQHSDQNAVNESLQRFLFICEWKKL